MTVTDTPHVQTLSAFDVDVVVKTSDSGGQTDFTISGDKYIAGTVTVRRWHSKHEPPEFANRMFLTVDQGGKSGDGTVCLTHDQARALMFALGRALAIPLSEGSGE